MPIKKLKGAVCILSMSQYNSLVEILDDINSSASNCDGEESHDEINGYVSDIRDKVTEIKDLLKGGD